VKRFAYVSAAIATVVAIVTIMIWASPGGSERAGSCGQSGWPAIANGSPEMVSDGYYAWHNAHGWHLRLLAGGGVRLSGRVIADAQIGLSSTSTTVRKGLSTGSRTLSFSFAGTGTATRIDFKAHCASKLGFHFGRAGSGELRVFLGEKGQAPTPSFRLQRPAHMGIAGRILIGPTCPVVTDSCPPAKLGHGTVRVETAPGSRGGGGSTGRLVKLVKSDRHGNFATMLPAGRYTLVVEKTGSGYPLPKPSVVDVEAGVMSQVTLVLDTGIR
jgi:hypothetical protein